MDLESIVLSLDEKNLAPAEGRTEINHVLGEGTIGYSTVTRYLRKQSFADSSTVPPSTLKSRVLMQFTMLFCKRLTNNFLPHFARLPRESWFRCQLFDTVW
jgi:hypothetical protein